MGQVMMDIDPYLCTAKASIEYKLDTFGAALTRGTLRWRAGADLASRLAPRRLRPSAADDRVFSLSDPDAPGGLARERLFSLSTPMGSRERGRSFGLSLVLVV